MSEAGLSSRQRSGRQVGIVGLLMNLALFGGKLFAGLSSNSIAIMADAFNSLADSTSAIATTFGFKIAAKKKDREHPYGHGRMEYIAGFVVSVVVILTAWSVGEAAIRRLVDPEPIEFNMGAIAVCAVAILAKVAFAIYARKINKTTKSHTLDAAIFDSIADCLATALSIAPILLAPITSLPIDGAFGLAIALVIAWAGIKFFISNTALMLGRGLTESERTRIRNIARDFTVFDEVLDLDVHDYGPETRILLIKVKLSVPLRSRHFEREMERYKKRLHGDLGFEEIVIYWPPANE